MNEWFSRKHDSLFDSIYAINQQNGVSSFGAYVIHIMGTRHPFSVYRGKIGEVRSSNGLGYDVVVSLMQEYQSQGYSLYIDNFYTSPTLVSDLYDLGVHVTGTLDCTRTGVPAEIPALKKQMAKKFVSRGEGSYVRDGVCVYAVWKDTKCVSVMSNEHPGHSESKVTRNVKDKDGVNQKKEVPIPAISYCYNCFMNGVDRSDQLIKNYNILRKILEDTVLTLC